MKTFDRKIADNSHLSLVIFFNSTSNFSLDVTKKVTCNILKMTDWFDRLTAKNCNIKNQVKVKKNVTEKVTCNIIQVVQLPIFDFVFQTSRNGRNENDKNKSN